MYLNVISPQSGRLSMYSSATTFISENKVVSSLGTRVLLSASLAGCYVLPLLFEDTVGLS